jgi:hypothetical protein
VFTCFKHWALKKSIPPGTELAFKRRFLAAIQEHFVVSELSRGSGNRVHVYRGIRLNDKAQKYIETVGTFDDGEIF